MMLQANNFSLKYEYENLVVVVAVVICSLFLSDIIPQTTDCPTSKQTDRQTEDGIFCTKCNFMKIIYHMF